MKIFHCYVSLPEVTMFTKGIFVLPSLATGISGGGHTQTIYFWNESIPFITDLGPTVTKHQATTTWISLFKVILYGFRFYYGMKITISNQPRFEVSKICWVTFFSFCIQSSQKKSKLTIELHPESRI